MVKQSNRYYIIIKMFQVDILNYLRYNTFKVLKEAIKMPDYKEMYIIMVRAANDAVENHEKADQILIEAMQKCEEMYIDAGEENDKDVY